MSITARCLTRSLLRSPAAHGAPLRRSPGLVGLSNPTTLCRRQRLLCTAPRPPPGGGRPRDGEERSAYSLGAGMLAVALGTLGVAYASVPLYRIFCQATGFAGTPKRHGGGGDEDGYDLPKDPMTLRGNRPLKVTFNSDVSGHLLHSVKTSNATYGHHGEMAWQQMYYF